jgi:uncharacterized protein YbaA (DUF1428 family)
MHYVDGFVLPVPRAKCVGDDVQPGKLTSFPQAVQFKDGEVAVFSWIVYTSRAERDRINALVMKDPRICATRPEDMPFDGMRMFWGGFTGLVELGWSGAPGA